MRQTNFLDTLISEADNLLRTLLPPAKRLNARPSPGLKISESPLSWQEKKHSAGLMRVNHAGEVCAQALYRGQALTASLSPIKKQMNDAAAEEVDHLAWCEERLHQLNSQPSLLNPVWYAGSMLLGILAGLAGDKISLGFVAETEEQVSAHLQNHLQKIPTKDKKSQAILQKMQEDEKQHAASAREAGAMEPPDVMKQAMRCVSRLMTQSSYYI